MPRSTSLTEPRSSRVLGFELVEFGSRLADARVRQLDGVLTPRDSMSRFDATTSALGPPSCGGAAAGGSNKESGHSKQAAVELAQTGQVRRTPACLISRHELGNARPHRRPRGSQPRGERA